ncbi:MAG: hypothetical protein H6823_22610 [Planctomycetaceae bacterium]|nr:hypothetical protein [Planctomycetaceae bacterium]
MIDLGESVDAEDDNGDGFDDFLVGTPVDDLSVTVRIGKALCRLWKKDGLLANREFVGVEWKR